MKLIKFFLLCGTIFIAKALENIKPYKCCKNIMQCYRICKVTRVLVSVERIGSNDCGENQLIIDDKEISSIASNAFKNLSITALIINGMEQSFYSGLQEIENLTTLKIHGSNLRNIDEATFHDVNPSIVDFTLSDNNIVNIGDRAFASFKNLQTLVIREPNLESLGLIPFYGLDELQILEIHGGRLTSFDNFLLLDVLQLNQLQLKGSNIKCIEKNTFSDVNLTRLSLEGNKIEKFEEEAFGSLGKLIELSLDRNNIKIVPKNIFTDLKTMIYLSLDNNRISEIESGAFSMLNLKRLSLKNNNLDVITSEAFEGLTVHELDLGGNHIIEIADNAFKNSLKVTIDESDGQLIINKIAWGLKNRELILVEKKKLQEIIAEEEELPPYAIVGNYRCCRNISKSYEVCKESDILVSIKHVKNKGVYKVLQRPPLLLIDNESSTIAPNTFKNLLTYELTIKLANETLKLTPGSFNGLSNLKSLEFLSGFVSLESNLFVALGKLTDLSLMIDGTRENFRNTLTELKNLSTLQVSYSNLKIIDEFTFSGINPAISNFQLKNNSIVEIRPNAFAAMKNLESLVIDDNSLLHFDYQAFTGLNKLQSLTINGFRKQFLAYPFANLTELSYLQISGSVFHRIEASAFSSMTKLLYLSLECNEIQVLNFGSFHGLDQLFSLSLDNNNISRVPGEIFVGLKKLRYLFMAKNQIEIIEKKAFAGLNLWKLNLNNNNLSYIDSQAFESANIEELDLSGNKITGIGADAFINAKIYRILFSMETFTLDRSKCKLELETNVTFQNY